MKTDDKKIEQDEPVTEELESDLEFNIKAVVNEKECIGCTSCVAVCPTEAITMNEKEIAVIDASLCIGCGSCVGVCPTEALDLINLDDQKDDSNDKETK